ncbi:MAG: hypothetical protein GTN99_06615, partial [Candidatus Dadabacteria bacterium]|nr:hypothetical protein [Candidatus Dadabacteria bacterium]
IDISLERKNNSILLIIHDTGIGIKKEELPHIFKRFYRAKKYGSKGTGLGLAICKKIAEKHNGSIRAESAMGEGSTFIVTLHNNL